MEKDRLVYSTESGRICPECSKPVSQCSCGKNQKRKEQANPEYPNDGIVRISREVKGRGGKTVTAVFGLPLEDRDLRAFVKKLKTRCGTGGSVKNGVVIIQGDHRETLLEMIEREGYKAKSAGG